MTTRALVSISHGQYDELLDLAAPSFANYAKLHGYELLLRWDLPKPEGRAEPWNKIATLINLLPDYDQILLLDCDVVIMRPEVPFPWSEFGAANHALVVHEVLHDGVVPNTGVWGVTRETLPLLEQVWDYPVEHEGAFVTEPWWDQSAYMAVVGYDPRVRPCTPATESQIREAGLHRLPQEWNVLKDDAARIPNAIIRHASGVANNFAQKRALMRAWTGKEYNTSDLDGAWRLLN